MAPRKHQRKNRIMLKPLEEADGQSAVFARSFSAQRRVSRQIIERLPAAIRSAPLSYSAPRIGAMVRLEMRLAELDLSELARFNRACTAHKRLFEITGKPLDFWNTYYPIRNFQRPIESYELGIKLNSGIDSSAFDAINFISL